MLWQSFFVVVVVYPGIYSVILLFCIFIFIVVYVHVFLLNIKIATSVEYTVTTPSGIKEDLFPLMAIQKCFCLQPFFFKQHLNSNI